MQNRRKQRAAKSASSQRRPPVENRRWFVFIALGVLTFVVIGRVTQDRMNATGHKAASDTASTRSATAPRAGGSKRHVATSESTTSIPPPTDHTAEFLAIADQLERGDNAYLGTAQLGALRRQLGAPGLSESKRAWGQLTLANHLLRLGKVDGAKTEINNAFRRMDRMLPAMLMLRATASLREAELDNCLKQHNRDCCLFPLSNGGVHQDRHGAQQAKEDLLAILEFNPDNLRVQWLVNIAAMALGEYPDGVPPDYRIPPNSLKSEYHVGTFVDVAPDLGVDPINLCGGAIVEDFNGDHLLDIVTSSFDPREPLRYFRNQGNGRFREATESAGLSGQLGGLNCISADYDNDGDPDVLVLRGAWLADDGQIRNSLLRNNGCDDDGRITFTDVTKEAGIAAPARPSQAAAWGDFDGDGDLDLYVANESGVESIGQRFQEVGGDYPCQLFRNNGRGADNRVTFTDIASKAGVENNRFSKGVTAGDFDNDGDLDLYVSNVGRNRLYRNNGVVGGNVQFTDVAKSLNVEAPTHYSFATWFFDYNNDGWLDLFVTAYRTDTADLMAAARGLPHKGIAPCLYLNLGKGEDRQVRFENVAAQVGLDRPFLPMGANFGDIDNDGFLDIYLATGDPGFTTLMPNVMLRSDAGQRFQDVTSSAGLGHLQKGHGVAFADIDNDGDQDIYNQLGGFLPGDRFHNALFLNPGHGNHYLAIQLRGSRSNRSAIGARIVVDVRDSNGGSRSIHRAVGSVSSFGGSPLMQEIGLGEATQIERVTITWPIDERRQLLTNVPMDSAIAVVEGQDGYLRVPRKQLDFTQAGR